MKTSNITDPFLFLLIHTKSQKSHRVWSCCALPAPLQFPVSQWCDNNWAYPIILKQHPQTCLSGWRKIRKHESFHQKWDGCLYTFKKLCTEISKFKCHSCWLIRGRWFPGDHRVPSRGNARTSIVWLLRAERRLQSCMEHCLSHVCHISPFNMLSWFKIPFPPPEPAALSLSCLFCVSLTGRAN